MSNFENHCWQDLMNPEILEIYRSYERETYVGKKPALLLIDLYNLAYDGGSRPVLEVIKDHPSSCGVHAWDALEPTMELIALARKKEIPIIFSTQGTDTV